MLGVDFSLLPSTINQLIIAFSAGLDSTALLHLLKNNHQHFSIKAIHVHHGLQADADLFTQCAKKTCQHYNIHLDIVYLNLKKHPEFKNHSLEAFAREKRYQALMNFMDDTTALITAHHQDDQAETFLLQCFRGAGPKGLSAMPVLKQLERGLHWRPLLNNTRDELKAYASQHALNYIDDPSNSDNTVQRNYLRNEIIPKLKLQWPGLSDTVSRVAALQAGANECCEQLAAMDFSGLTRPTSNSLVITELLAFSTQRLSNILRHWLLVLHLSLPSFKKLQHIIQDTLHARYDAQGCVSWQGTEVRQFAGKIYARQEQKAFIAPQHPIPWDFKKPIIIDKLTLTAEQKPKQGLRLPTPNVLIKFRSGGERIQLHHNGPHLKLKNLFQQWQVPTWERDSIPLVYAGDVLVQVGHYAIAFNYMEDDGEGWVIHQILA